MTNEQLISIIIPCVIAIVIFAILVVAIVFSKKATAILKNAKEKIDLNEEKIYENFKKVLPEKMCVELLPLVKDDLKTLFNVLEAKLLKKQDAIIKALASMRSMPDVNRAELIGALEQDAKATAKLVEVVYNVSDDIKAMAEGKTFTPDID